METNVKMKEARMAAGAVRALAVVDRDGLVHLGPLDMYARAMRVTEDEADELLDYALELLEDDGTYQNISGSYYDSDKLEEAERLEREEEAEHERYERDVEAAWRARF